MTIIYFFIDGIGLGQSDPEVNPFTRHAESFLTTLGGGPESAHPPGWIMQPTDAHMGFKGLPQSATGQTSLWTGINGSKAMGRHMTGFPGPTLKKVIQEHSIVKRVHEHGKKAQLLNAFGDAYFRRIEKHPRLISASTHIQNASGQRLLTLDDLEQNRAMYMDITHEIMHEFFPDLKERFPVQKAYDRGRDLVRMSREYDLALYEYFISDKVGHNQDFVQAEKVIGDLENFLRGITDEMGSDELLLVTSDHGNLEDLSTKTHTDNKVPTFAYGKHAERVRDKVQSLMDIPGLIYELLEMEVDLETPNRELGAA